MLITIEEVERQLMTALLAGDDPMLTTLRQQYESSTVKVREFTGVGYFTNFAVPEGTSPVSPPDFEIKDVFLELQGVENGAMAMLFVRDGLIDVLEICTLTGSWPDELKLESIYYSFDITVRSAPSTTERDMDALRKEWEN